MNSQIQNFELTGVFTLLNQVVGFTVINSLEFRIKQISLFKSQHATMKSNQYKSINQVSISRLWRNKDVHIKGWIQSAFSLGLA